MLNPGAATAPRDWELKLRELKLSVVNLESPLHRRRRLRARNASTLMALLCCRSAAVRLEKDCDELDTVLHGNWRPEESGEKTPCATTIFSCCPSHTFPHLSTTLTSQGHAAEPERVARAA